METLLVDEERNPRRSGLLIPEPNVEDARRRFLLALRSMALQRGKEEEAAKANAELIRKWTAELNAEIRAYRIRRWRRTARRIVWAAIIISFPFLRRAFDFPGWWWIVGIALMKVLADERAAARGGAVAEDLARTRDPRALSVLAIAARSGDSDTRSVATKGLKSLLHYVKASDREDVTADGMAALIGMLRSFDWELVLAVLKALAQVGDARAIPEVKRLAESYVPPGDVRAFFLLKARDWIVHSNSVMWEQVREEAKHCLVALQSRAELDRQRNLLLRPSRAPDDPSAVLLRPATAGTQTPEQLLLRPAGQQ